MKKRIYYIALIAMLFISACSNDFLDENKKEIDIYTLNAPLFLEQTTDFVEVSITLPELKNKSLHVFQYPKMIHFDSFDFQTDETGLLKMKIKADNLFHLPASDTPYNGGNIVLNVKDMGFMAIHLFFINYGNPKLAFIDTTFEWGFNREEKIFSISNANYDSYLVYRIVEYPDWITITSESATNEEGYAVLPGGTTGNDYSMHVNTHGLAPGEYSGKITIESNDKEHPLSQIEVKVRVSDPKNMYAIEGTVKDCEFDKNRNILYIATAQPDKILVYDTDNGMKVTQYDLPGNTHCLTLSENGQYVLVGQDKQLSVINLSDFSEKRIPLDFDVADVADGDNGFYYLSSYKGNNLNGDFYSYEISTGTMTLSNYYTDLIEGDRIVKVKGKPCLFTTRSATSPGGIYWIDISEGKPQLLLYRHEDTNNRLWYAGNRLFTRLGYQYSLTNEELSEKTRLDNLPKNSNQTTLRRFFLGFDVNPQTKSIWGSGYFEVQQVDSKPLISRQYKIIEWDLNTLEIKRTVEPSYYDTVYNGKTNEYATLPHYIFTNSRGEKMYLVKNIYTKEGFEIKEHNKWLIEVTDLKN